MRQIHISVGCISESEFSGLNVLSLSTALQQSVVCNNLCNLHSGQEVTVCHHQKEPQFIHCLFLTSNLQLDPLQLCLHVLQLMSAVQHLLTLLLSGGVGCAERQAGGRVSVYYFSALLLDVNTANDLIKKPYLIFYVSNARKFQTINRLSSLLQACTAKNAT